jgi:hypothetical protein
MMVVASDSAEVADAVGPSPSGASLRGLDGVNLLTAGAVPGKASIAAIRRNCETLICNGFSLWSYGFDSAGLVYASRSLDAAGWAPSTASKGDLSPSGSLAALVPGTDLPMTGRFAP